MVSQAPSHTTGVDPGMSEGDQNSLQVRPLQEVTQRAVAYTGGRVQVQAPSAAMNQMLEDSCRDEDFGLSSLNLDALTNYSFLNTASASDPSSSTSSSIDAAWNAWSYPHIGGGVTTEKRVPLQDVSNTMAGREELNEHSDVYADTENLLVEFGLSKSGENMSVSDNILRRTVERAMGENEVPSTLLDADSPNYLRAPCDDDNIQTLACRVDALPVAYR